MTEEIRAFVAIELPDQIRAELAGMIEQLRRVRVRGLRLVNPDGIHLTLKFLGNVPKARVDSVAEAVSHAAAAHPAFAAVLEGVGVFPDGAAPSVLWVGVGGDLPDMLKLHQGVDEALGGLGYARERRQFSAHLTVARIGRQTSSADRLRAREALYSARVESGLSFKVDFLSLMRSMLRPEGARYERLARMPLGGGGSPGESR